ncbi:RNA polymerase sigma-70 factor (ECF subfamily) [Anaerobacterium chartisolvens]|uniref:RNA polymerase sigma-70 factor (ECF subfamily) n=1 Tax=Anaerobacterium chartisolvens TaxID=1297424 RepID=A0A369B7Q5_9FIRM|nr:sigma-70 family RNA polymerase sigma factor [Anaerobacterium chartisolvens]RCX17461.1 RNA polymerase sigma-70 factor (ECF subfamily) [Anaerobacterium chartisolvens]
MQQHVLSNPLFGKEIEQKVSEEEQFSCIFEACYKRVYNYIYYRVYCQYTAEDLTSQAFEKAMLKIATYEKSKSPFEVWLFAIARNVVNDHFRGQKKQRLFSLESIRELVSSKKDPEGMVIKGETNDMLSRALNTLSARERNIIALRFGGNLKNREIADILHMTESNVGVTLYRTMRKLKNEMKGEI